MYLSILSPQHFFDMLCHHITILLYTLGEVEKPCVLSLIDDTLYEEGEELRLVLGNPKSNSKFGASVGALNETVVKIKDTADSKWGVQGNKARKSNMVT